MDRVLTLPEIVEFLRNSKVFRHKYYIQPMTEIFAESGKKFGIRNGDDAASIPHGEGSLLLAAEGIAEEILRNDPYLAGKCAVLANVNDIYAMGGRPLAMVDVIGTATSEKAREICRGIRDNAFRFNVPVVGGHVLRTPVDASVSLAILGYAREVITSFDAQPGDNLLLVRGRRGAWLGDYGFWNCTLPENDDVLVPNLDLLPQAAEAGLVNAGKDVSMAGIAGTTIMLAESSAIGVTLDLEAISPPNEINLLQWLLAFMSYGFVLAVSSKQMARTCAHFQQPGIEVRRIGEFHSGHEVILKNRGDSAVLWDFRKSAFAGGAKS